MPGELRIDRCGAVLRLGLNRPQAGNALTYPLLVGLRAELEAVRADFDVRAVVLEAEGDDFCLGEDPQDMGEWPAEYAHRRPGGSHGAAPLPQQDLVRSLRSLPKPTFAMLKGSVLGFGLDIACACDLRLARDDTVLGDRRVHEARHAATGITWMLPRLIGQSQAMRLLLLGDTVDAAEARRLGLVHEVLPHGAFETECRERVDKVASMATRSWAIIKQQVTEQLDLPYETALLHSIAVRQTNVIEDRQEGQHAFVEKREPRYTGR